jgi:elongator complex protein 1
MRSLALLSQYATRITGAEISSRSYIAIDAESGTVFAAFPDNSGNVRVAATGLAPDDDAAFVEIGRCPESPIVNFDFLADLQVACLCLRNGDIIHFSKEKFEQGEEAVCFI